MGPRMSIEHDVRAPARVLVVGASASGLTTAETLRRKGYAGAITVLGDEPHVPYDRPPLSKQVLSGAWAPERAALRTGEALAALDAEFVRGDAAVGLDLAARCVRTESGRELQADAIVIATGVRARRLPGTDGLTGWCCGRIWWRPRGWWSWVRASSVPRSRPLPGRWAWM